MAMNSGMWVRQMPLAADRPRESGGPSGEIRNACGSEYATTIAQLKVVMAGLDPAIHVVATSAGDGGKRVDARVALGLDSDGPSLA